MRSPLKYFIIFLTLSACLIRLGNSCSAQTTIIGPADIQPLETDKAISPTPSSTNKNKKHKSDTAHSAHYPPPTFKIAGFFNRLLQQYIGLTVVSEVSTDYAAQHILRKKFGGKIKVKVKTYSFTDLVHLKVRTFKVEMNGCHYKNIPLGKLEIEGKTPFWLLLGPHKHPRLQQSVLLTFKMQINDQQLDEILHSERVTNVLRLLKIDLSSLGPGLDEQKLQMHQPEVVLDKDTIILKAVLATPNAEPGTASPLTISGQPVLHGDDRVFLEHVVVESPDITESEKFSKFVEQLINPLIKLNHFDRANFALRLDEISVKPNLMSASGRIIIGPDSVKPKQPIPTQIIPH